MVLRLTANCWLTTSKEVKAAIKETGLPVTTAAGYDGWIGDFIGRASSYMA